MRPVMMVFITPCWKSARPERGRWLLAMLAGLLVGWLAVADVRAETDAPAPSAPPASLDSLQVERDPEGLRLSARVTLVLPRLVEEALLNGIPMHFVVEADVLRARWYWYDKHVVDARRYLRLAYQPLTRRWRLSASSAPLTGAGLGAGLGQHFDSLQEALAATGRIVGWQIATPDVLEDGVHQTLRFRFWLDVSQLPRALQIGTMGRSPWQIEVERRIDLTQEAPPRRAADHPADQTSHPATGRQNEHLIGGLVPKDAASEAAP